MMVFYTPYFVLLIFIFASSFHMIADSKNTIFTQQSSHNKSKNSSSLNRFKRYVGSDTLFFKESELQIRERIAADNLDLTLLPKFGGKDATRPYTNLIQVLTHTRSNVDGPVDGTYDHTTGDTISVSVDPVVHKFSKGQWAVYAGTRQQRCMPQLVYGNGHKAVFDCFMAGTYYAFFRVTGTFKNENDVIDGVPYRRMEETQEFFDASQFLSYFLDPKMFFIEYEKALLQDKTSLENPWYYSDPIKIVKNSYCYRWSYRLIKENEVGFVHFEPNPAASGGIYKEYTVKVWIADPSEVSYDELYSPTYLHPSSYSQVLTKKFALGGLVPCLRFVHPAIEVISDAQYIVDGDVRGLRGFHDSQRLLGPYWGFKIKIYYDRVAATLSDISVTITPRQHSALYECFIADVRVTIPSSGHAFLPNAKVPSTAINLRYSWFSDVDRRFFHDNVLSLYGHEAVLLGSPFAQDNDPWVPIFSNPCVNQELTMSWNGTMGMTWDFCANQDMNKIILPSFDKSRLIVNVDKLHLSDDERKTQRQRASDIYYTKVHHLRIGVFDFAYSPAGLMILINDSSVYTHSPDLALRGIGYTTYTQKYKLGALVKRMWCARSSTAKSHNMWIPAFSRKYGNFIVIYQVPVEGAGVIRHEEPTASCEAIHDSTKDGHAQHQPKFLSEREIHADEADDARIDRAVEAKLRTKAAEAKEAKRQSAKTNAVSKVKTRKDVEQEKTFWMVGNEVLSNDDPHYSGGFTNAKNVRIAQTGLEHYNDHVIFEVDTNFAKLRANFEQHGLSFGMDETIYANGGQNLSRPAPNERMFSLHSIQFTGVEKRYLVTVGFQSEEFPKTIANINSTLVIVTTFLPNDLPVVVNTTTSKNDIELRNVEITFSGSLIRRLQSSHNEEPDPNGLKPEDFVDEAGNPVQPAPLSKLTTKVNSINTALPLYVLRMNDVILFASLDGSFAKPILSYEDYPTPDQDVKPMPFLPFKNFEILVTEQGVLSVLSHKETSGTDAVTPSEAFIGSLLANEPLRYIHPFHLSNNIFQVATEEGEIVYGQMSYDKNQDVIEGPPNTKMLNIPFWSLLKGSFARSAGDTNIPLDRHVPTGETQLDEHIYADPICPFASFDVYYVPFPYVESQYVTRITAEVAYYGDVIPLEADVIVEFAEVQGVSIVVSSFLEVESDQTVIRKIIEIETFLPQPELEEMYNRHYSYQSDDDSASAQSEYVRVFTLTIRPSLLNLHCQKKDYFRTIQMNIGCVPFTSMRLIAEALPLKKIEVQPWRTGLTKQDRATNWYHDPANSDTTGVAHLLIPRDHVHYSQRTMAKCMERNQTSCQFPIPAGKGIEDNIYGLSFRDVLIPKFEQFLTQHARRVTGNVVIYDLLDSYKSSHIAAGAPGSFAVETNTSQYTAGCLIDDGNWYGKMASRANFYKKELTLKADIYRYFVNCFRRTPSYRQEDLSKSLPLLSIQELNNRTFFLFNRSNMNALRLQRRRNFIYLFRAVVVNTEFNPFTYCSHLETYFALQVANISVERIPLRWELYVSISLLAIILMLSSYVYFSRYKHWRTRIVTNRIFTEDLEAQELERQRLEKEELDRIDPFRRVSQRIENLKKFHTISAAANPKTEKVPEKQKVERKPVTLDLLHQRISMMSKAGDKKND